MTPRASPECGGQPVHVRLLRPASAAPALRVGLVHGLEETCDVWAELVPLLIAHAEVHAFGLPWDGKHERTWAWECEPERWVARAMGLLPATPSVLIAHSFGANALLEHLVAKRPDGLTALTLLSPFYRPSYAAFDWGTISYYLNEFHRIMEEGIRVRLPRQGRAPGILSAMGERLRDRIGPHGWLRFFDLFARTPGLDLRALTVPCLVIGGENDFASWPADCRALAEALPIAEVEILSGCGHFAMLERPEKVAASINRLLQRCVHETREVSDRPTR